MSKSVHLHEVQGGGQQDPGTNKLYVV